MDQRNGTDMSMPSMILAKLICSSGLASPLKPEAGKLTDIVPDCPSFGETGTWVKAML